MTSFRTISKFFVLSRNSIVALITSNMINALLTRGFVPFVFPIMLINPILKKKFFFQFCSHTSDCRCLWSHFSPFGFTLKSKSRPISDTVENTPIKVVHQGMSRTGSVGLGPEVRKLPFTKKLFCPLFILATVLVCALWGAGKVQTVCVWLPRF